MAWPDQDDIPEDAVVADYAPRAAIVIYALTIGLGIAVTFMVGLAGYRGWSFLPAILLGAVAIGFTRFLKRWVRNILSRDNDASSDDRFDDQDQAFLSQERSGTSLKAEQNWPAAIALVSIVMGVVSAFWYLVGMGFRWII